MLLLIGVKVWHCALEICDVFLNVQFERVCSHFPLVLVLQFVDDQTLEFVCRDNFILIFF